VAKRPDVPVFPTGLLIGALAVVADLTGLTCLFLFGAPVALKATVGGLLVLIPFGLLCHFIGKKKTWREWERYVAESEWEIRRPGPKSASAGAVLARAPRGRR
jgi:uncharacterized membrane protein